MTRFILLAAPWCGLRLLLADLSPCRPDKRSLLPGDLSFSLTGDLKTPRIHVKVVSTSAKTTLAVATVTIVFMTVLIHQMNSEQKL